jgi:hypothetical protein
MGIRGVVRNALGALAAVMLLAGPLSATAHAADFNLTASPLPVNLSVKPGETVSTPLRVQNTGNEAVTLNVSLKKFGPTDTTGKPSIVDPEPSDDFIQWVHFSETSFRAEPNVWHTVTMTIRTPKDAAFGYYYAVIFSHAGGQKSLNTDKIHSTVKGAIASLVLLDVNAPGEKRTLSASKFTSTKKIYEYLPATFTVTVHNSGNVHAIPAGDVFIGRNSKSSLATLELNSAHGNVLPGTDRQFQVSWNDGFPSFKPNKLNGQVLSDKNGKPKQHLDWNGLSVSKFRIGRYNAHLVMTYNDGTRDVPVEGDLTFWVIPWKLILVLLLLTLLILAGLYMVVRLLIRTLKSPRRKR